MSTIKNNDELSNDEITDLMQFINNYRKEFEVPELIYNDDLTQMAKPDAIKYLKCKRFNLEVPINNLEDKLSKNITYVKRVRNQKILNIKNIIKKWYNENKYYDFENENNINYDVCQNFINLIFESNVKCGFWYSYVNGNCVLCMYFSE